MGKITGFLEFERNDRDYESVEARIKHWREFVQPLPDAEVRDQAARCMNCGIPYCHTGCPVNNQIPDWNRYCPMFRKVMPLEYRRALAEMEKARTMQAAE